ncbi:MAG: hypothetical protein J2O48_04090 [Solirubrobacterales bacterium]|nr:hypothetical protein [Solirubrobacterales bacterium]
MTKSIRRICVVSLIASAGMTGTAWAATPAPPTTLKAHVLKGGKLKRGTTLKSVGSQRDFVSKNVGFALGGGVNGDGPVYPALSTDGGKTWKVDGPSLFVNGAANAPAIVSEIGASSKTLYAYGPSVIDVSVNQGKTWYQVFTGQEVGAVAPKSGGSGLYAFLEQTTKSGATTATPWQYVLSHSGNSWSRSAASIG